MIRMSAACGCHRGKVRSGNQDNFYFRGQYLEAENDGLEKPLEYSGWERSGMLLAVFDGMGGENYGEMASYAAAKTMQGFRREWFPNAQEDEARLRTWVGELNAAVMAAQQEHHTDRMGTTLVGLYLGRKHIYAWNVGDSRCYLLREGTLRQLSRDHVEPLIRPGDRKAPLTQYLGLDPQERESEPGILRETLQRGDRYLLCSDGVTDMLGDEQIQKALADGGSCGECVQRLIAEALEQGGKDNITAIVCEIG